MLEIRPYRPEDWSAVCDVHDRARLDELVHYGDLSTFVPLGHNADESTSLHQADVWVVWDGRQVFGFVALDGNQIVDLCVDPDANGRDIGRRLLREAIQQASGRPWVFLREANAKLADLFEQEGFVPLDEVDADPTGAAGPWVRFLWAASSESDAPNASTDVLV